MTKFKLNISKVNEHCESFEHSLKKYDELSDKIYANVKNSDNVWMDPASMSFNQIVCRDESNLKDIKVSLGRYRDNLFYFSQSLGTLFNSRGYSLNDMSVYYDSSYVDICINKLNNVSALMQSTLNEFGSCIVPEDFEYLSNINDVYNATANISTNLSNMTEDIRNIRRSIDTLMTDTVKKNSDIELVSSNDKVTRFNWTITPLTRREHTVLVKENTYNVIQDNLHAQVNESPLNSKMAPINIASDTIFTKSDTSMDMVNPDKLVVDVDNQESTDYKVNESSLNSEKNPINIASDTIFTKSDTSMDMANQDELVVTIDNQETTSHKVNNHESDKEYDIESSVIEGSIDSKKLNTDDNQKINISPEITNNVSFQVSRDEQHTLEQSANSTNVQNIKLDQKTSQELDLSSIDTETGVPLN